MGKLIDLTGQRFGRWTVIERAPSKMYTGKDRNYRKVRWLCLCDCGNSRVVDAVNLIHQRSHSCGCLQKEIASNFCKGIGKKKGAYRHGDTVPGKDRLYHVWASMKQRCRNKNCPENCRWVSMAEQAQNRRNTKKRV